MGIVMPVSTKTRNKILEAALDLFVKKGYNGSSTRAIATKAGVNEVTLFRHFGTKERLFREVVHRETNIATKVQEIWFEASGDIVQDLTLIGINMAENLKARASIFKLLIIEVQHNPWMKKTVNHMLFEIIKFISAYFSKAQKAGLVKDGDPELMAIGYFSFFFRSLVFQAFQGKDIFLKMDKDDIRGFVEIFVDGIRK